MTAATLSSRARRHAQRIINKTGRWFHPDPDCPHGTWSGYTYWGCQCPVCLRVESTYRREAAERKAHNARIIAELFAEPITPPLPIICTGSLTLAPPEPLPVDTEPEEEREDGFAWDPPPMTPKVRESITSVEQLEKVCRAYYEPEIIYPDPTASDRKRRRAGDTAVTVIPDGTIIFIAAQEESDLPPTILASRLRGQPKAKGGRGGRRTPRSTGDIIDALRRLKANPERDGGGHWRVPLPGGGFYTFPSTPNGGNRSVENTVAALRRHGLAI